MNAQERAQLTRAELYASGKRAAYKNQCKAVIVALDHTGEYNYHNCSGKLNHLEPYHETCMYLWQDTGEVVAKLCYKCMRPIEFCVCK